jgi:hypothetical protein
MRVFDRLLAMALASGLDRREEQGGNAAYGDQPMLAGQVQIG